MSGYEDRKLCFMVMEMPLSVSAIDSVPALVAVRIRFAGTQVAETFHMMAAECKRLHAEWKLYLGGSHIQGGEYQFVEADRAVPIFLNFRQIVYTEPGRTY
jgi:hypothetical protein